MREGARKVQRRRRRERRKRGSVMKGRVEGSRGMETLMTEALVKFKPRSAISYSARSKAMPRSLGRHQMGSNCDVMFSLKFLCSLQQTALTKVAISVTEWVSGWVQQEPHPSSCWVCKVARYILSGILPDL